MSSHAQGQFPRYEIEFDHSVLTSPMMKMRLCLYFNFSHSLFFVVLLTSSIMKMRLCLYFNLSLFLFCCSFLLLISFLFLCCTSIFLSVHPPPSFFPPHLSFCPSNSIHLSFLPSSWGDLSPKGVFMI